MNDPSIWPRLIAHYRKRHALTQTAFAERFGVTQQTVSRWESGVQAPHLEAQTALRSTLGLGALSDSQAWIARVTETFGCETLFDDEWRIAAISDAALKHANQSREELVGKRMVDLVAMRQVGPMLEQVPLFDGTIRALKVKLEVLMPAARLRQDVDIWPIFTMDEKLYVHVTAFDAEKPQPRTGAVGTNILAAHVVLVDGSVLPVGGKLIAHQ